MSLTAAQKIEILQRFVDTYASDMLAVRTALGESTTPEGAQRFLIGGLNYALDLLDMFPDHYQGLGVADDAIVLRLSAKLAVGAGATGAEITRLAEETADVAAVFEDLAGPLEKLVATLPDRDVRGRTATKILGHKDTRITFEADIGREAKRHTAAKIETKEGPDRALIELRKMVENALQRANIAK